MIMNKVTCWGTPSVVSLSLSKTAGKGLFDMHIAMLIPVLLIYEVSKTS